MEAEVKHMKIQFWISWTLLSFFIIPVTYMISLMVVLLVHGAFGFNQMEGGTYLSQTAMQVAGGAVIGLGTGLYQRFLLKRVFHVSSSWIFTLMIGFALTELIVCIILWQMGLNRYELRFIEFRPLPEALFFACAGLIIGLIQWTLLRRFFSNSVYWIFASTLGWGICIFVTLISIWAFFLGALLYGAITGATFMWILKRKEENLSL
jgi:hypothetical protein